MSVQYLLPNSVIRYIQEHSLYVDEKEPVKLVLNKQDGYNHYYIPFSPSFLEYMYMCRMISSIVYTLNNINDSTDTNNHYKTTIGLDTFYIG